MADEKLSVIVPAYNNAPWLPRCLDSLLAQTYENLEIIVVDDGSTDDTKAVMEAYTARDGRIKAIHKPNGGVTSARLRGVAEATGDWIGFVDGDDEVESTMYERLLRNAHTYGADISHCGHQVIFPDGRINFVHNSGQLLQQDHLTGLRDLLDGGLIESGLCTKIYREKLFAGLDAWMDLSIKCNEDLMMNYYLFEKAGRAVYEDFCPYRYILRQGSASYRRFDDHSLFDPIRVRQKILEHCAPEMREEARRSLLRTYLFIYGQLALRLEHENDEYRSAVRKMLTEQKKWFYLLSARNKVLANMICTAPWTFHLAYGIYVKLFQREEQH